MEIVLFIFTVHREITILCRKKTPEVLKLKADFKKPKRGSISTSPKIFTSLFNPKIVKG